MTISMPRSFLICATAALLSAVPARADLVSVNSIGTINMAANSQSGVVTIGLQDLNPSNAVTLLGWSLGLRVVPLSGATGTVTLDQASFADASNNIFQDPPHAPSSLGVGDNNPAPGDFTVSNFDDDISGVTVLGTTRNLVDLKFNASSDASGNFALQLVDFDDSSAALLQNSYWFDENYDQQYLAVDGAAFTSGIQLGTISVAAVPEPSSMILGGVLVGLAGWKNRRRRQSAAAQAGPTNSAADA